MTFKFSEYPLSDFGVQGYCFHMRTSIGDVLLGSAEVLLKNQGCFWLLSNINIEKDYQGQGYGSSLLKHLRNYLWHEHSSPIRVHPAMSGSEWLKKWYIERGFAEEDCDSSYLVCQPPDN
jgi:GNAT superfamily N-acetyltransferase